MKRFVPLFLTVAMALVFAVACGDDDGNGTTTDTTPPQDQVEQDMVEADVPGTDMVEGDMVEGDVPMGEVSQDVVEPPAGACMNEADGPLIDTEEERDAIRDEATTCGLACTDAEDPVACSTPCVMDNTGLTEGCSGCYAAIILCSIQNCLAPCVADAQGEECVTCQEENGCISTFYECSGLTPPEE